jgi:hypothetical protein
MNPHTAKVHQYVITLAIAKFVALSKKRTTKAALARMAAHKKCLEVMDWQPTGIWGTPKGRKAKELSHE